mgnify:CR=1 FL=1
MTLDQRVTGIRYLEPTDCYGLSQYLLAVESQSEMESIGLITKVMQESQLQVQVTRKLKA